MTMMAYFIRDWHHLQLAFACEALLLILMFFLVPESPRWELGQGNIEATKDILISISKKNGIDVESTEFNAYFEALVARGTTKKRYVI